MPVSKHSKRKQSETEDSHSCSDSENELKISKRSSKKKKMNVSSESSDDEPLLTKISSNSASAKYSNVKVESEKNGVEASDDNMPLSKMNKKTKTNKASFSSDSSDDELLVTKACSNISESSKSMPERNEVETSDDDMHLNKLNKTAEMNGKSKEASVLSDSSDDEPLSTKIPSNPPKTLNSSKSKTKENEFNSSDDDSTDDDDEPLKNIAKKNKKSKQSNFSSSDADNESLGTKESLKDKSKKQKNGHVSSNENMPISLEKSSNVKDKKVKSASNDKIEHLKKYVRLSGIHIQSYEKFFADCKSIKSKTEKLLSLLHEKGLKGRPTIEKCKKLRKKIETKKEISELDMSNIIQTEGRPKRGSGVITKKPAKNENSPTEKRFSRLKDIIDSEESD